VGLPLGIVHRDVSPSNVIVSSTGQVKLIDFGLAKSKQQSVQSQAGVLKGKLNYVAPEYLSGKLDARCDLWALGVCMHELLTGGRLFDAPEQGTILERVRAMPIPPPSRANPEVPPGVDQIVLTALERDPAKRWPSAAAMRSAIATSASVRLTPQQLVAWVEWAFSQKQPLREDSAVSMLHEIIESKQTQLVGEPSAMSAAMEERRRESLLMMPLGGAMLQRDTSRRWVWIVLLLLAAAGAGLWLAHRQGAL
jgi:serine/threonine protein kinase